MKCPKCGKKMYVDDVVHTTENEVYRRKVCKACGHGFFTVEYEIEADKHLADIWFKYRGRNAKNVQST